jgi:hypothetical protein
MSFSDYALIDAPRPVQPKERVDDDVRQAMREVAGHEHKHRLASELGASGLAAVEQWDRRIEEIGPNAAIEAAQLYQAAPRLPAQEEEQPDPDDHINAARSAYRSATAKADREAHLPTTLAALDRHQHRHGDLRLIERFKHWDTQLRENPADAAPRIATEISGHINDATADQWAHQTVNDYFAQNTVSSEERVVMQRLLATGAVPDLPTAHRQAQYELAMDIKEEWKRDAVAAKRQIDAPQIARARVEYEAFKRIVNPSPAIEARMNKLLESEKAFSYEEAYKMAKGVA